MKCEFVDPSTDILCNYPNNLTKIVFEESTGKTNIVIFACKKHGDMGFNVLSMSEDEVHKNLDRGTIEWGNFKEELKEIRWNKCRKCNERLGDKANYCVTYYALKGNQIRLRRSFILDFNCAVSELRLYGIGKEVPVNQTLDGSLK